MAQEPSVTARRTELRVSTTLTYEVSGAPDMPIGHTQGPRMFRPDRVTVRLNGDKVVEVTVSGPRVLKGDRLSDLERGRSRAWWGKELDIPDWVRDVQRQAVSETRERGWF